MSVPIVTFDEAAVRGEPRELVRQTAEDTLNALLEEADDLGPGHAEDAQAQGPRALRRPHVHRRQGRR